MSIDNYRKQPMHQRLFNPPINGGVSTKHLWSMIIALCERAGRPKPHLDVNDRQLLASYIQQNFNPAAIDWAHEDRKQFYKRVTSEGPRSPRMPIKPMPRTNPGMEEQNPFPPPQSMENKAPSEDINEELQDQETPKRERKIREPQEGEDELYVLRREYADDQKALVEEFSKYDKQLRGQQKAINDACSRVDSFGAAMHKAVELLDSRMVQIESHAPFHVKVKYSETKTVDVGIAHKQFPLLVKSASARLNNGMRLNIWLYGPAGTGKTYAAESLAKCEFGTDYCQTVWTPEVQAEFQRKFNQNWKGHDYNGSLATQFQVFGYMDATGRYVSTAFRRIWEYGGVYLFDEIDGSMPDALLALQGALSSEYASFPDGLVKRHKDCIILAGANTTGLGGGVEYVGAMKQNAAFLNRWVFINWDHDDALEDALCADKKWVRRVRQIRNGVKNEGIRTHLVTMRQSMYGEALLRAGIDWEEVERMTLRTTLTDAQWERVRR